MHRHVHIYWHFVLAALVLPLTMNQCLEAAGDFISLDIEDYEAEAILGLDLERLKPLYLLIECKASQTL